MAGLGGLFLTVVGILLPVILITLAGFIWAKRDPNFRASLVGDLALHLGVPALLFSTLLNAQISGDVLFTTALASLFYIIAVLLALRLMIRIFGGAAEPRVTGLSFANWGNLGMPLCLFAFGSQGLTLATTFFAVSIFLQFTLGWRLAAGAWPWKRIALLPILWVLAAVVPLTYFDVRPPEWVMDTAKLAGGLAIPAMLLSLGGGLARMSPSSIGPGFIYALVRLVMGLALGFAILAIFDFPEETHRVILFLSIMPLAVFNFVLTDKVGGDSETVAGYIMTSTLLGLVTLPIALLILL